MKLTNVISSILVVIGAINWGLWGFFQFDLVAAILGGNATAASRIVYSIVGVAGLYKAFQLGNDLQRRNVTDFRDQTRRVA